MLLPKCNLSQNSQNKLSKQPLVLDNFLPCHGGYSPPINLEEEGHSAAERRKHMREQALCGKAKTLE